jgi:hypothetical protein
MSNELTISLVDPSGGLLEDTEGLDERGRHPLGVASDVEVHERSLGLSSPVSVRGDLERSEGIGLGSVRSRSGLMDGKTRDDRGKRGEREVQGGSVSSTERTTLDGRNGKDGLTMVDEMEKARMGLMVREVTGSWNRQGKNEESRQAVSGSRTADVDRLLLQLEVKRRYVLVERKQRPI